MKYVARILPSLLCGAALLGCAAPSGSGPSSANQDAARAGNAGESVGAPGSPGAGGASGATGVPGGMAPGTGNTSPPRAEDAGPAREPLPPPADAAPSTPPPPMAPRDGGGLPPDDGGIAAALNGFRWEMKCMGNRSEGRVCDHLATGRDPTPFFDKSVTFGGTKGIVYDVRVHIRGIAEPKQIAGGMGFPDHFKIGGTPRVDNMNAFRMTVSSPMQTYFINDSPLTPNHYVIPLDEMQTIKIEGGATVRFTITDADTAGSMNCKAPNNPGTCNPIEVPGVPPSPMTFDGQFAQIDVLSVTPAK